MPQFDLNFEFWGQTTETEVSVQEENEPVTERTRFIALEEHELNEASEMLKQEKHHFCEEMEVYVVESHNNGMVSQLFRSNKILMSFRSDCYTFWKAKLVIINPTISYDSRIFF